jgi:hypothetical protein
MKYLSLYRIVTYLLLFFAATHTVGGLLISRSRGPEADAVLAAMRATHFACQGADCTWYGLYFGFGLLVTVFLLFSAAVCWRLGGLSAGERAPLAPVAWALFICHILVAVLSWTYFFIAPGVVATLIAVLLGIPCIRPSRGVR